MVWFYRSWQAHGIAVWAPRRVTDCLSSILYFVFTVPWLADNTKNDVNFRFPSISNVPMHTFLLYKNMVYKRKLEPDLTLGVQSFPHPGPNSKGVFIFSDMNGNEWTNQSAGDGGGQLRQLYGCHYGWVHRISENREISENWKIEKFRKISDAVRKTKT